MSAPTLVELEELLAILPEPRPLRPETVSLLKSMGQDPAAVHRRAVAMRGAVVELHRRMFEELAPVELATTRRRFDPPP